MAKLLYSATAADGTRTEGFVNAPSAVSAREQLEQQGLRNVVLHQEPALAQHESELDGLNDAQRRDLARFKLRLMQAPTLQTVLAEQARRMRFWLLADGALVAYGLATGKLVWVAAGVLAAAVPFAFTAWNFRHADRYQRLMREFAVGNWDAVRVLAKSLRSVSGGRPELDFDLDLRLAGIYARDHELSDALARVEAWRPRWARQPGYFEMRVSAVHHMAGDGVGFVSAMAKAHELSREDPSRRTDHALAEARFGSIDQAEALLADLDASLIPPHGQGFLLWARGLIHLRRGQAAPAEALLAQAVAAFLQISQQPAVWTALALCACDQAVALHQSGRHEVARSRIAQVWPVLEVHASVPLLRMLEADDLLPPRRNTNT